MQASNADIKQLYSYLGLDPRDYVEVRPVNHAQVPPPQLVVAAAPVQLAASELPAEPVIAYAPPAEVSPVLNGTLAGLFQQVKDPMLTAPAEDEEAASGAEIAQELALLREVNPAAITASRALPVIEEMAIEPPPLVSPAADLQSLSKVTQTPVNREGARNLQDMFQRLAKKT